MYNLKLLWNSDSTVPKPECGLYQITHEQELGNIVKEPLTVNQLYHWLGHISPDTARKVAMKGFMTEVKIIESPSGHPFFCESCIYAKVTCKPMVKIREGEWASAFGDEVHSDLWGPAPVEMKAGRHYYVTLIDDMSHLTHLYLLCNKSDAFLAYKEYAAWCETHLDGSIKTLHLDHGGGYLRKGVCTLSENKGY